MTSQHQKMAEQQRTIESISTAEFKTESGIENYIKM